MSSTTRLCGDGVWSWFSDPRALCDGDALITGWVTKDGVIQVARHDLISHGTVTTELELTWEADDHDSPTFVKLSDGRYTAFYCWHSIDGTFPLYRTSLEPGSVVGWGPMQLVPENVQGHAGATYVNPLPVPCRQDAYHLFWRGADYKPTMSTGTYDPSSRTWTWSGAWNLISVTTGRPYVKYADDAGQRIGLAFTNGHPKETENSIYYAEIRPEDGGEAFFRADGSRIKDFGLLPLQLDESDVVFDCTAEPELTGGNSWVWDVAFDEFGAPVVTYVTFPSKQVHQYHWARFNGAVWEDAILVWDSGGSIADTTINPQQHYYSGGIVLDPNDPETCYLSRRNPWGGWDIDQWKTDDGGDTWSVRHIALGTADENVRPVVPRSLPDDADVVLWLNGQYDFFEHDHELPDPDYRYDTSVLVWSGGCATGVDFPVCVVASLAHAPNPFSDMTTFSFVLSEPGSVELDIYGVNGRIVRTLCDGRRFEAGPCAFTWDGTDDSGHAVASGVYFARVTSRGHALVRRVLLVR